MVTLIITEKPDAARRIAEALAENGSLIKRINEDNVAYYEFIRNNKKHIVACAVGHLFNLDSKDTNGWSYPVFEYTWRPSFEVRRDAGFSKKYFDLLKELARKADDYIVATDYDIEGDVIGFNILRFICGVRDAKRMKFSTLTKDELIQSYENILPHLNFGQVEAGLTRHELDWLWGINLTRALTLALRNHAERGFAILSTGRVQGPLLKLLVDRELEIRKFVPKPFWQIKLHLEVDGKELIADYEVDKIWKKEDAEKIVKSCEGKEAKVENIKRKKYKQLPPTPFNTTDLQSEAYAQFKFSPTQTLNIAETLYQQGFISYPRSASQKFPPIINYRKILQAIATLEPYKKFAEELLKKEKLIPHEGKATDPAHPAVTVTHEVPDLRKLTPQQRKIYDLICRRTLATFADPAIRESMNVLIDVDGKKFKLVGKRTIEEGWISFYSPYIKFEEQILPELKIGQRIKILKLEILEKQTQPPGRYSQGSIIKELEKRNLGTKSTRAEILQTLYDRNYIKGKSIEVNKLGEVVVEALKENCPKILSEELTRYFEKEMDAVFNSKKKREEVVEEAKATLENILEEFKKNEKNIGKKLLEGLIETRREERKIGVCPNCGGELRLIVSRKTGKRFVGCSNYPKCKTSFPIPLAGKIAPLDKVCEVCKLPIIQVWRKGKRPFKMCINPKCNSKNNWNKA
jgi:DNA topoisomerase-1